MIYKVCERCGRILEENDVCHCNDRRLFTFYTRNKWRRIKQEVLDECDGIDLLIYTETGERVSADVVHHIYPILEDWSLRYNKAFLIPLSSKSHAEIEAAYKQGTEQKQAAANRCIKALRAWQIEKAKYRE